RADASILLVESMVKVRALISTLKSCVAVGGGGLRTPPLGMPIGVAAIACAGKNFAPPPTPSVSVLFTGLPTLTFPPRFARRWVRRMVPLGEVGIGVLKEAVGIVLLSMTSSPFSLAGP